MMLNKRLNYEFRGYQLPVIPRAPRSIRRKTSQKKTLEDGQICAFELLATVAGEMLLESESTVSSFESVKVKQEDTKPGRPECLDQTVCIESGSVEQKYRKGNLETISSVIPINTVYDSSLECKHISKLVNPEPSNKIVNNVKLETMKSQVGSRRCYTDAQLSEGTIVNVVKKDHNSKVNSKPDFILGGTSVNNSPLVNSSSSVQFPSCLEHVPNSSFLKQGNHVKAGCRDDDENYVGCNGRSVKSRIFRPHSHFGYRRIRKLLTSKYWKVAPKLKDCDFSLTNKVMKPISANWNTNMNVRSQLEGPSRKRKFYDHRYECKGSSECLSNSTEKCMKRSRNNGSPIKFPIATGPPTVVRGHQPSFQNKDSHVKLSIKSFRVPDLYIDVPETATVGSLKMKVMEAVRAIIEDGLHVGVLLQGKKVRDDNRTLLQSGICGNGDLDALGFILEPLSSAIAPPPPPIGSPKDPSPVLVPCGTTHHEISNAAITQDEDEQKKVLSSSSSIDEVNKLEVSEDLKTLVPVPAVEMEMMEAALDIVPINQKPVRRLEIVQQRRTRRPFTVTEVESLVEAVEKLGTGRWRDVKLSAFEYAEYRTYVDLKDKWKTLVHTASISPQQRRGEPVPQELLDRVQAAHAFWSHNQSRPHIIKQQQQQQHVGVEA